MIRNIVSKFRKPVGMTLLVLIYLYLGILVLGTPAAIIKFLFF